MKTAIAGVWHVHVDSYTEQAQKYGTVVGAWDPDPKLLQAFCDRTGVPAFGSWEQLLRSEAEGIIVCAVEKNADGTFGVQEILVAELCYTAL